MSKVDDRVFDFTFTLERVSTDTKVRYIKQLIPIRDDGQWMTPEEFELLVQPFVEDCKENYPGWNLFVHPSTNEEIAELSDNSSLRLK